MEVVIAVLALLFLLVVVGGAYVTVKAVRAAKRGVDRTLDQARRTVQDTALRAKSYAQPGPVGEVAQLRLKLRTTMRATQETLRTGVAEDHGLAESLALFDRLSAHGHALDAELRHLESEPDRTALARQLPELRRRTEQITSSADSLRWAARDRASRFAGDDLDTLGAQIDIEAGALRHWTPPPGTQPAAEWPDPAGATEQPGAAQPQTWADSDRPATGPAAPHEPPPARPALTEPAAPQAPYPWQKDARTENTP